MTSPTPTNRLAPARTAIATTTRLLAGNGTARFFGGAGFLLPYLLLLTVRTGGYVPAVLLGARRAAVSKRPEHDADRRQAVIPSCERSKARL